MPKYIFALGFFDGVHLGHQALLTRCREIAEALGLETGAVTFDLHPKALTRHNAPGLLNTPADRCRLLRGFGIAHVVELPFDEHMRNLPWEDFLELLCTHYGAAGFVCGDDYHFGHFGSGNAKLLADWCRQRGLPFGEVPGQTLEGTRISSTHIRSLIQAGAVETAVRFLGHPHILTGTVVPGKQLGRTLGIPTANLRLPQDLAEPRHGVYACRCLVEGRSYPAVTNVGTRPTVNGQGLTIEPWLLGYTGDLYNKEITLEFYKFLREEKKFDSLEDLKAAIRTDAEATKQLLE